MNESRFTIALLLITGLFACRSEKPRTAMRSTVEPPHGVVDSIFTVDEYVARFKARRANARASELSNAAPSRDALVARFIEALETHDTTALRAMAIDEAEFIDLYYPASMYVQRPYKQDPELVWFLMRESGGKGIRRALQRFGGRSVDFNGYACTEPADISQTNRFHGGCTVRWSATPGPVRLFGPIIERNGQFKFLSYTNDL